MNDVVVNKKSGLPANIKDLTKFILVGREKLVSVRAEIRAMSKIGLAKEVREQKLDEVQMLADALLDAETRMGELLKELPEGKRRHTSSGGSMPKLPEGISHKQSHFFQILADNKDIVEQVKAEARENEDFATRTEVLRIAKLRDIVIENDNIRKRENKPANGKYDVIVIDPPWPIEKIGRKVYDYQDVGLDYPTMTIDEIENIELPCAENCHLFLWTTQKYLPLSFDILEKWNMKYIFTMVWHKNGGFQPFNLPQYNCEFVLYARQGSPKFIDTKAFNTCFSADRTKHSEKPEEFYELLRRVTVGKRIDMFNRRTIIGFDGSGNQS